LNEKQTGMNEQKFSVQNRLKAVGFAFEGVIYFFKKEHNAWIHAASAIMVLAAAYMAHVSAMELIAILLAIGLVWVAEIINTSIEEIMDHLSPQIHPSVKVIKDLAAAAVLIAAFFALLIGFIIFIPKFL
jgi:diacylglycerol kinase (ATP)